VKEQLNGIRESVSTCLRHARVWVKEGGDTLGFWEYKEPAEDHSRFGENEFECPECEKVMHIGVKKQHLESHEENEDEKEESPSRSRSEKVRLSDYVDDYEIGWEEEEKSEIEIQEATGGQNLRDKQLRKKWRPFLKELRESGEVHISSNHHHGGLRGAHIVQKMKSDLKRVDIEMDLDYDIGETKSTVRRRN